MIREKDVRIGGVNVGTQVTGTTSPFNNSFTLYANQTYNITFVTGSYLQIIHEHEYNATGGKITRSEFVDVNGKRHEGWIPAIRIEWCKNAKADLFP